MQLAATSLVLSALCACVAFGSQWDDDNDPSSWSSGFEYSLNRLPSKAKVRKVAWSDTYWPSNQGGIANRWQDDDNDNPGFDYKLYSVRQLKSGRVDLRKLSPAEKFDIYNSRYDYPLVKSEWKRTSPSDDDWEGICDGWAPAAILYEQPGPVTLTNKDGIKIPFGASDVKALLSYFLAQFASGEESSSFIANRCNADIQRDSSRASDPECADINAGSFHIMLTNLIGLSNTAFVADIDRSIEVWNQPITGYEYTLGAANSPSRKAAPGTVTEQSVSMTMYYTEEADPSTRSHKPIIQNKQYEYVLDLDRNGEIIGGSYAKSQWDRVDFIWDEQAPGFFGYFTKLETIYLSSTGLRMSRLLQDRPRRRLADYKPTIVKSGAISLSSYDEKTRRSWLIPAAPSSTTPMRISFKSFNTRRHTDILRVFEVENSSIGAPVAILSGPTKPADITIRPGVSALLTFGIDKRTASRMVLSKGTGFELVTSGI